MTDDTTPSDPTSSAVLPMSCFAQDGTTVTLLPNADGEYDVRLQLSEGSFVTLSWFAAVLLGKALAAAGDIGGRANYAWRTQDHIGEWTRWLAELLGVGDDPAISD